MTPTWVRGRSVTECSEDTELWLPVVGFEGWYEVSSHGHVRSIDRVIQCVAGPDQRHPSVILRPAPGPRGHLVVGLYKCNESIHRTIHTLVLRAFAGPPPPGMEGCHWDGNPANNHLDNLRWDTRSANTLDRVRHGTHQMANRTHCPRKHPLESPNLVVSSARMGRRGCLACNRAAGDAIYAAKTGRLFDFEVAADKHYEKILAGDVSGSYRENPDCPRGHPLLGPNLIPTALAQGRRDCLACNRARGNVRYAEKVGRGLDFQEESDKQYQRIIAGAISGKARERAECSRGHMLKQPNLVPAALAAGRHVCLACERARGNEKYAIKRDRQFDFQAVADRHYVGIMET